MRSLFFLLVIITIHSFSYSQGIQFEKILPLPPAPQKYAPLHGIWTGGGQELIDIDLDGDLDLILLGALSTSTQFCHKLINSGTGYFEESASNIYDFYQCGHAFADIDGDLDPDLLVSGKRTIDNTNTTILYINDGTGNFSESTSVVLPTSKVFAFSDFDGDLDLDIVITDNFNSTGGAIYLNDGVGNFVELVGAGITNQVNEGKIETFDFDHDGDNDIIVADYEYSKYYFYLNDGAGNFLLNQLISKTYSQSIYPTVSGDINNDNYVDLFAVEEDNDDSLHLVLYKNDGLGNFEFDSSFVHSAYNTSMIFADFNGDSLKDLINIGDFYSSLSTPITSHSTKIFFNDGNGDFIEDSIPQGPGAKNTEIAIGDIDSDGDFDLIYSGNLTDGFVDMNRTILLENNGFGEFKRVIDNDFVETKGVGLAMGDLDHDGDLDLITGSGIYNKYPTAIYFNDGNGNYSISFQGTFPEFKKGGAVIEDFNNDGYNDFIIAGTGSFAKIYFNNGSGHFNFGHDINIAANCDYLNLYAPDVDNDGDFDLMVSGDGTAKSFKNDGSGNFTQYSGGLIASRRLTFKDFNGDSQVDFSGGNIIKYNDGSGNFSSSSTITALNYSDPVQIVADFDNDGFDDFLISGYQGSSQATRIYFGDGAGNYIEVTPQSIGNIVINFPTILDIDSDGFEDLACYSRTSTNSPLFVLLNDTQRGFYRFEQIDWQNTWGYSLISEDVDGDLRPDILTSSRDFSDYPMPRIYRNVSSACINTFSFDTIITCDSLIWMDGNTYYNDTTGISYTLVNANIYGCDSTINLDLTIKHHGFGIEHQTVCDSLVWIDGNTYYTNNNTATYRIPNGSANGCDSIVLLELIVNQSTAGIDVQSTCDSLVWMDGNTYYTSNNTASYTIPNGSVNGCDSIVTLNFSVIPPSIGTDLVTACDSLVWIDGNTYYTSNNTASYTIPNGSVNGCDSIVSLDLTIIDIDTSNTVIQDTIWSNQLNASYQWLDSGNGFTPIAGETGAFFVPDITGNYAVEIIYSGCVDTSSTQLIQICDVVSSFTSIDNGNGDFEFTSYSTGNINKLQWNFGDGSFSNQINPQHDYSINGPISVSLAVQDSTISPFGSCVDYYYDFIAVSGVSNPNQCLAAFIVIPDSSSNDLWVINNSSGTNLNYTWDFGDGASSNLENPSHLYSANGAYNLCLAIDDLNGCSDTFCDSVSYLGSVFRQSGFSINIISGAILAEVNYISDESIKISPNPALDFATLVNLAPPINSVKIYASNGKFVGQFEVTPSGVVDIQMLSAGVYYILIETPDSKSILRLVKE